LAEKLEIDDLGMNAVADIPYSLAAEAHAAAGGAWHWRQGLEHLERGDMPRAVRALRRATRAAPADALYWLNLANAYRRAGEPERAAAAAERVLALEPTHALALQLLGECLSRQHRYAEALAVYERLQDAGHAEVEILLQHGANLLALRRPAEAAQVLLRAAATAPEQIQVHALTANALRDMALQREAVECLKTVLALEPDNLQAMAHLSYEKRHVCDWASLDDDLQSLSAVLQAAPPDLARPASAFSLLSLPLDPALHLVAARGEALAQGRGVRPLPPVSLAQRAGRGGEGAPLRLALLSFDFHEHPVSQLIVEMLERLDRSRFEVWLYSTGPDDASALRQRIVAAADQFIELRGLSDAQAAARIRADGADLLVDLQGHTRGQRLAILAHRPAPLQVGFLGYPGSSGAGFIDYLIGDPIVTPLELAPLYSEKLAQMPLVFQPNGRWRPMPQAMGRAEAGLPQDAFVLCAFNHTYKILPQAFDAWCAVLRAVPHAVLWLKETNGQLHANVRREAQARGVSAERIAFAPGVSYAAHFSRLALADVFVDTWPYNAHTTAADALWAGVPVVTLYGNSFASRVAASVLNAAGLGELAFQHVDDYVNAVLALAEDGQLLAGYKGHLQRWRKTLPLFDSSAYAKDFGGLLQRMWGRWQQGLPAELLA
jgi:predicted O-linked N-acetylglucosamine transferase (SPINDLY family)